jgi:hypothetical protein
MTLKYCGFSVVVGAHFLAGCGGTVTTLGEGADGGPPTEEAGSRTLEAGHDDAPAQETGPRKPDAAPDAGLDHGSPSETYPAFTPFMPQVTLNPGGQVIQNPNLVTVSFTSLDSNYATWETFDDALGASSYWSTATMQYGVGAGTGGTHVELTTTPSFSSMTDVEDFVAQNAGSAWPPSTLTADTLYVIYMPPGVSYTIEGAGDACSSGVEGYHDVAMANGNTVVFAVVFQCSDERTADITTSTTHEAVEASTDPVNGNAYVGLDDSKYFAWDDFQQFQDELADMCEFYFDSEYVDPTLGQYVQRIWSNQGAPAGHAPCVPAETGAYFNVTPLMQENVSVDFSSLGGPSNFATLGYYIPVGGTKTIPIGFYSDGAAPPWNIVVYGGSPLTGLTGNVSASVDVASGTNGNISYITVKVNGQDQTGTNSNLISIESKVPGDQEINFGPGINIGVHSHWMPILVSSQM